MGKLLFSYCIDLIAFAKLITTSEVPPYEFPNDPSRIRHACAYLDRRSDGFRLKEPPSKSVSQKKVRF